MQRIGKYEIERRLGSGSFATVWLAYDPDLDARVAIKVLANNWSADDDVKRRFLQEARMLFRLNDPRVIRAYTTGSHDDGCPYFVMDYADRGNLEERIAARHGAQQRFDVAEALRICREIADAMAVIHRAGIVHRDLKPSNVLYRSDPELPSGQRTSLGDFGVARAVEAGMRSTIVAGSPFYMAPEQAEEETASGVDQRADIYAVSVILYELLTGRVPYPFSTISEIRRAQDTGGFVPLGQLRAGVPESVVALVERGMCIDPEGRFPSAHDLLREIDRSLADLEAGLHSDVGEATLVTLDVAESEQALAPAPIVPPAPEATLTEPELGADAGSEALSSDPAERPETGTPTLIEPEIASAVPLDADRQARLVMPETRDPATLEPIESPAEDVELPSSEAPSLIEPADALEHPRPSETFIPPNVDPADTLTATPDVPEEATWVPAQQLGDDADAIDRGAQTLTPTTRATPAETYTGSTVQPPVANPAPPETPHDRDDAVVDRGAQTLTPAARTPSPSPTERPPAVDRGAETIYAKPTSRRPEAASAVTTGRDQVVTSAMTPSRKRIAIIIAALLALVLGVFLITRALDDDSSPDGGDGGSNSTATRTGSGELTKLEYIGAFDALESHTESSG